MSGRELPFDAVTLDLYGTVLDFSLERHEPPLVESLLCMVNSSLDADAVLATWLRASLAERAKEPFRTVEQALLAGARVVREQHGLAIEPAAWVAALEALWADRPLAKGAGEALDRLVGAGLRPAIVTNLDQHVLDSVWDARDLDRWIDVAITSERARAYKPHPRPYYLALDRLGVAAGRAVHLGDSRSEDGAGAAAAGLAFRLVSPETGGLAGAVDRLLGE